MICHYALVWPYQLFTARIFTDQLVPVLYQLLNILTITLGDSDKLRTATLMM